MNTLILSLNDIPLILVIFQSLLFSIFLLTANLRKRKCNMVLAFFIFAIGIDSLDTLIYWSTPIREIFLTFSVNIFFSLKFGVYLAAPMLYLYVKATLYSDFHFDKRCLIHFVPLILFPIFTVAMYLSMDANERLLAIRTYSVLFQNPFFQMHLWVRYFLYIFYGCACIYMLSNYKEQLKQRFSNIEYIDMFWLKMLIGGFLTIWLWVFFAYVLTLLNASQVISDAIGIAGNFFNFIFVNALALYSLANPNVGQREVEVNEKVQEKEIMQEGEKHDEQAIEALLKAMTEDELFLNSELTLEQLAENLTMSPRRLSVTINKHFNQNFFDFVNSFRVEKAAAILAKREKNISMLDVMADAGFNSKSTFYRSFKKHLGLTPSEYGELHPENNPNNKI